MSLVNPDWQSPSRWAKTRVAWGAVIDGDTLRLARLTSGGGVETFQESVETFRAGSELKSRMEKDRNRGGLVVVGLEPRRLMIRELISPIADPRKADDIWLTLFDAAVPFRLEDCQVALPVKASGPDGLWCLAVGARSSDLEAVRDEWTSLGLEPDLIVPEALALTPGRTHCIWCGETRTVWSWWRDGRFLGAGGLASPENRDKTLARQFASHELDAAGIPQMGPGADAEADALETNLARAALSSSPLTVNLCNGDHTSPALRTRWEKRTRQVRILGLMAWVLALLMPFLPAHWVRMRRQHLAGQMSTAFETLAGYPAPPGPPGYEATLAEGVVEEEWSDLRNALERVANTGVSMELASMLEAARREELRIARVTLNRGTADLRIRGESESLRAFMQTLEDEGWVLTSPEFENNEWRLRGEQP